MLTVIRGCIPAATATLLALVLGAATAASPARAQAPGVSPATKPASPASTPAVPASPASRPATAARATRRAVKVTSVEGITEYRLANGLRGRLGRWRAFSAGPGRSTASQGKQQQRDEEAGNGPQHGFSHQNGITPVSF